MFTTTNVVDLSNPVANHWLNYGLTDWWMALPNNRSSTRFTNLVNPQRVGIFAGTAANRKWGSGPTQHQAGVYAISLNGAAYATCGTTSLLTSSNYTIAWTMRVDTLPGASGSVGILTKRNTNATRTFQLYLNTNSGADARKVSFSGDVGSGIASFDYIPTVGVWAHYVMTMSGGNLFFYVNGRSTYTIGGLSINIPSNTQTIYIGALGGDGLTSTFTLDGSIGEISVWNYAVPGTRSFFSLFGDDPHPLYKDYVSGYASRIKTVKVRNKTTFFLPVGTPKPRQGSQDVRPLPDFGYHPVGYDRNQPTPPNNTRVTRQPSQDIRPATTHQPEHYDGYSVVPFAQWFVPGSPPSHQTSQDVRPLPDFNLQHYEAQRQPPQASWYVPQIVRRQQASQVIVVLPEFDNTAWRQDRNQPLPPDNTWYSRQPSQVVVVLPEFDDVWYEQRYTWPVSVDYTQTLPEQRDQRIDPLPDFDFHWYEANKPTPYAQWYIPGFPWREQASQDVRPLPDYDFHWYEANRQPPQASWYVPEFPWREQSSQDVRPLPDFDFHWYEANRQPPQASWYVPEFPRREQPSQDVRPLPVFDDVWYEQRATWAVPVEYIPTRPTARQPSQDFRPLVDFNNVWYEQRYTWPVPVEYIPPRESFRRPEQRVDPLPVHDSVWWQQLRLQPLPSGITNAHLGISGIFLAVVNARAGAFKVANDIAGYNVYMALDALPDLAAAPVAFSTTLPVNVPVTPPVSGLATVYVVVRARNVYGLESKNQQVTTFLIDSSGNLYRPPVTTPANLRLSVVPVRKVRIQATYATLGDDEYPATTWRVWLSETSPIDYGAMPVMVDVGNQILTTVIATTPGVRYVGVKLYRGDDAALSLPLEGEITVPDSPDEVVAVPSGYDL